MAWTTPKTWASGYVVLASDLNTHLRDNLNVTAPAVLTTAGDILYASGANTPARLAKSTTSTQYLANTGTSNIPAWNEVALATGVSGTLPVGNGGTGATTFTANGILVGNSTSAVAVTATMATKGHVMGGDGSGVPSMLAVGTNDYILTADSGEATGVKWAAAAGGGQLTLIGTAAASTSASLTITGLDSTYDSYLLLGSDLHPVNDGIELWIRVGDSSGIDSGASDYSYHVARIDSADANYLAHVSGGAAQIALAFSGIGNAAGEGIGFALWLHRPGDGSTQPMISGTHTFLTNLTAFQGGPIIARRNAVITLDRVEVRFQTGSIVSGRFTVFGAKHD